jgi:hypothetical protein
MYLKIILFVVTPSFVKTLEILVVVTSGDFYDEYKRQKGKTNVFYLTISKTTAEFKTRQTFSLKNLAFLRRHMKDLSENDI